MQAMIELGRCLQVRFLLHAIHTCKLIRCQNHVNHLISTLYAFQLGLKSLTCVM
jgi:hypothetical protein